MWLLHKKKRLASLTGKESKDFPFGLVASFLEKSESRIRISGVGSFLKEFPLSGVSLKKHLTGTHPLFNWHSALLPYSKRQNSLQQQLGLFLILLPFSKELKKRLLTWPTLTTLFSKEKRSRPPMTTDLIAGDLANNETPNLK